MSERNHRKKREYGKAGFFEKGNLAGQIKKEPVKAALFLLLAVQLCLIAHSNIALIGQNLDYDTGCLFNHIAEMWRRKALFIPDWDYVNTLELDCSSILALPLYTITGDIVLSFGISNIVLSIGFVGLIFFLFQRTDLLYPLFCANLLLIPFRVGMLDYYNMLFFGGGQYLIKIAVPLLTIGVLYTLDDQTDRAVSSKVMGVLCLALIFLTSMSSGIYVAACGIFPIYAVYFVYKFLRWEKVWKRIPVFMLISGILIIVGWRINGSIVGSDRGSEMTFCSVYQMIAGVNGCIFGMFELFGGMTADGELKVMSVDGLGVFAKYCFVILLLVSGIVYGVKCAKKRANLRGLLLLSVFVWNLLILLVTFPRGGSNTYEYRYHLIGMLPLVCVACIVWIDGIAGLNKLQQNIAYGAGCLAIVFLCAISYRDLYSRGEMNGNLKVLCEYVKQFDVEYVYMYESYGETNICRVIDDSTSYLCLLSDGIVWADDYYAYYVGAPMVTENVIVVVNDDEQDFGDTFEIAGHALQKSESVANRSLYYFAN